MATIELLYFGALRERLGRDAETIALPPPVRTVGGLLEWLRGRDADPAGPFAHPALLRAAVNQSFAPPEAAIGAGDEVALFPPVTGG